LNLIHSYLHFAWTCLTGMRRVMQSIVRTAIPAYYHCAAAQYPHAKSRETV